MVLTADKQPGQADGGIVALVPAKLTSVRLPRKNIADLSGYPMFFYSVRAAQLCSEIDTVYVSSESSKILECASGYDAETIARPQELSAPNVTNLAVLLHALEKITLRRGVAPELVVLLQPTHPLRPPGLISEGIRRMRSITDADTLMTVVRSDELRGEVCAGRFVPEFPLPRNKALEPKRYRNTGSFYIYRVATTLSQGKMFSGTIIPLILDRSEFEVDVDEAADLALARCVLKANVEVFQEYFTPVTKL